MILALGRSDWLSAHYCLPVRIVSAKRSIVLRWPYRPWQWVVFHQADERVNEKDAGLCQQNRSEQYDIVGRNIHFTDVLCLLQSTAHARNRSVLITGNLRARKCVEMLD